DTGHWGEQQSLMAWNSIREFEAQADCIVAVTSPLAMRAFAPEYFARTYTAAAPRVEVEATAPLDMVVIGPDGSVTFYGWPRLPLGPVPSPSTASSPEA